MSTLTTDDLSFTNLKIVEENDDTMKIKDNITDLVEISSTIFELKNGLQLPSSQSSVISDNLTSTDVNSALNELYNNSINRTNFYTIIEKFDNKTNDSNPGDEKFRFNNSTLSSATESYINILESTNSIDVSNRLSLIPNNCFMYVQKTDDSSKYVIYELINSTITDETDYFKFTNLNYIEGTSLENKKECIISFKTSYTALRNLRIPTFPLTSGKQYYLLYDVDTHSFSWDEKT